MLLLGLASDQCPPASASGVAGITELPHHTQPGEVIGCSVCLHKKMRTSNKSKDRFVSLGLLNWD
jgi:hypothetical protein